MPIKLNKRIEHLERRLRVREKVPKLWDTHSDNPEKLIADIIACNVINRDGSFFSENDVNYFLDIDKFAPKIFKKSGQKYANTKN